jgi:hypothetical protein
MKMKSGKIIKEYKNLETGVVPALKHHDMRTYGTVEVKIHIVLNTGTRRRSVVSYTLQPP